MQRKPIYKPNWRTASAKTGVALLMYKKVSAATGLSHSKALWLPLRAASLQGSHA